MTEEEGKGLIATGKTFEELADEYLGDTAGSEIGDDDLGDLAEKYLTDLVTVDLGEKKISCSGVSDSEKATSEKPASSSTLEKDDAVLPAAFDLQNKRKSLGSPASSDRKQRKTEELGEKDQAKEKLTAKVSPTVTNTSVNDTKPGNATSAETKGASSLTQEGGKHEKAKQVETQSLSGGPKTKESRSGGPMRSHGRGNHQAKYSRDAATRYSRPTHREQDRRGLLGHFPSSHNHNNVMARPESQNRNGPRSASHDQNTSRWNSDRLPYDSTCNVGPRGEGRDIGRSDFRATHPEGFDRRQPLLIENIDFRGPPIPNRQPILKKRDGLLDPPQPSFQRNEYVPSELCRRDGLLDPPPQQPFNREENSRRNGLLDHPPQPPFSMEENSRRNGLLDPPPQPAFNREENGRRNGLLDHPPQPGFNREENSRRNGLLDPPPQPAFNRDENFKRDGLLDPPHQACSREQNMQPMMNRRDGLLDPPQPSFNRDENFRRDGMLDPMQPSFNRNENFRRDGLLDPPQPSFNRDENFRRDGLLDPPQKSFGRDDNLRRDGLLDPMQPSFNRNENVRRDGLLDPPQQSIYRGENFRRDGLQDPPQPSFGRDENLRRDGLLDPPHQSFNRDENFRRDGLLDPPQPSFNRDENFRRDGLLDPPQPSFNRDENLRRDGLLGPPHQSFNRDENFRRDGLLNPPQPSFNRDENFRRDGLLDPPQPSFNRAENFRRDGLLDPPHQSFNRDESFRRDGLLDPPQQSINRGENFRRDGLLDPPHPSFGRDEIMQPLLNRTGDLLAPLNRTFVGDENSQREGLLEAPHPTFGREENKPAMLLNRRDSLLDPPHPSLTWDENNRRDGLLDPPQPSLGRGENSQKDGLLYPRHPVPTPNRRGLLDPPHATTLSRDTCHFDYKGDGNERQVHRSHPKPHLPRGDQGNGGQSVNQRPHHQPVEEPPKASCSVREMQRTDARKPREFRRGVSVHEFVTKLVLSTFSTTRSATLTVGKYSMPANCQSAVPPEINFQLLKRLPKNIQNANTVLMDCQRWLARGMTPLVTQVSMFGKAPQTSGEVCRRTTDSLRILACACVNISKARRLLMRCHLPEEYGVLCKMSNSITSYLFGDKVDEDIRWIQAGTSKSKMLNGPNEEAHIPRIKSDLLRDENIDEDVANMVNRACTKEGIVKDLREKYKIPSNLNCMTPPKLNPEISSMLPAACVDLDSKLHDVQLSTSEAMVPGVYLLERIHEKMYNDCEALGMLTDALALLGDAMFQYNNLRMELFKENLPLQLQQECVWGGREADSKAPDCK